MPRAIALAYNHSTETIFLSVHQRFESSKIPLSLSPLSAFASIDHYNLLERLSSWFGISSTALSSITS